MHLLIGNISASVSGFDSDYELITTTVLSTATETVTFSNLGDYSSTYKHLQIRMTAKLNVETGSSEALLRFNSDTGSNYAYHDLTGNGSSVTSAAATSQTYMLTTAFPNSNSANNRFGAGVIDILDPYSTSKNTTVRTLSGQLDFATRMRFSSGVWLNTNSITSITIIGNPTYNMQSGSRFSLYGVK
jgi:hypothetical protein